MDLRELARQLAESVNRGRDQGPRLRPVDGHAGKPFEGTDVQGDLARGSDRYLG